MSAEPCRVSIFLGRLARFLRFAARGGDYSGCILADEQRILFGLKGDFIPKPCNFLDQINGPFIRMGRLDQHRVGQPSGSLKQRTKGCHFSTFDIDFQN